jgi:enoyl-CoA hydratase/carnithine racemase
MFTMTTSVLTSISNAILHIEFNRPEKKNALTLEMYKIAAQAIEQAGDNSEIRAIVLSGRGGNFTSGNDLTDFLTASQDDLDNSVIRFIKTVPACNKPIIAAVQGYAVGIGTTVLLHCDLVYADASAKLQMPFVNLALCPEFGSSLLLPQLIGQRRATELLMLGKTINAATALEYGLLNGVVDNCLETAKEQAGQIAALPAAAIRVTKQLLHQTDKDSLMRAIEAEGLQFSERLQSPEAKEAMTAFMEKRAPDFTQFD